ncbi:mucin-like glycoprotein, partial [Trypanosoma conorhini]
MATMLAVRRRAVCALALLALLCGCCAPSVCGTATATKVKVLLEVSCADSEKKLRWRVAGEETWQKCSFGVEDVFELSGKYSSPGDSVCAWAVTMYPASDRHLGCSESAAADTVAVTLRCGTDSRSEVYKRWLIANKSAADQIAAAASSDRPGTLTSCATQTSSGDASEEEEEEEDEEEEEEEEEVQEEGEEKEEAPTQLSQGADKETGDVAAPSNLTPNSDAEEAEEAADEKEKRDEEEGATEGSGGALAPPPLAAPAAASAPRTGAAEQAVGAQTSEQQRGPSPPADGAATAAPVGDATPRSGPMDDGQAQQTPPSHAPEAVGGVPSASAAPTGETPNAAAEGSGADPQTAADVDGGHETSHNAATAPAAQAPGQPGTPPTRDA